MRNALQTNRVKAQPSTTAGETVELQGVFRLDYQAAGRRRGFEAHSSPIGGGRLAGRIPSVSCPLDRPAGTLPPGIFLCCQPAGPLTWHPTWPAGLFWKGSAACP